MGKGAEEDKQRHGWTMWNKTLDLRTALDTVRDRGRWRHLVKTSSSANAWRKRKEEGKYLDCNASSHHAISVEDHRAWNCLPWELCLLPWSRSVPMY